MVWERWKKTWESELDTMVLHALDGKPTPRSGSDYCIFVACGPLRFNWRASEDVFRELPANWMANSEVFMRTLGDPRTAARLVIQYALIDGRIAETKLACATAAAIAWLLSTSEVKLPLNDFRYIGYDISGVPGPLNQARMFNVRAILTESEEQVASQFVT
jgi:hypothetical protein